MSRTLGSKNKPKQETGVEIVDKPVETVHKVQEQVHDQPKPKVRQYSNNRDHKGEGEPLCLNCGHRSDMHYIEHRWTEQRVGKNLQGDFLQIEELKRRHVYDGARPCQHACLCKAYE